MKAFLSLIICCFQSLVLGASVAGIGDSIMAGYPYYSPPIDGGPSGDPNKDPMAILKTTSGDTLSVTNLGHDAYKWSQIDASIKTNIPASTTWVIAHCGINDIDQGVTWASALSSLNSIKTYCDSIGAKFVLDEIFPDSNFSDANAAIVRQWNVNYANWASTNGAYLLHTHDAMGQIRLSTGEKDDLKTDFDSGDGVHLSVSGRTSWMAMVWNFLHSRIAATSLRLGTIRGK